jgi:hypothetical protein
MFEGKGMQGVRESLVEARDTGKWEVLHEVGKQ